MTDILKSLVRSKIPSESFKSGYLVDSEEVVNWIPLILCREHGTIIGLSADAEWVLEEKAGLRILDETWKFLRVIVLLEQPRAEIHNSLTEAFNNYQIFIDVDDIFPFVEIVKVGFDQKSDYWAELALNGVTELPQVKQKLLLESLRKILDARWASQKLRHRAKKELRKIEKN